MAYSRPLYLTSPQMYGSDVREMQQRLVDLGYDTGTIDGYFGPNSRNAVIAFQGKNGLDQDGSCGPATWNKLFSSSAVGTFIYYPGEIFITKSTSSSGITGHAGIVHPDCNSIIHISGPGAKPEKISISKWFSKYSSTKVIRHTFKTPSTQAANWARDYFINGAGKNTDYAITPNPLDRTYVYCSELVWQAYYYGSNFIFAIPKYNSIGLVVTYTYPTIIAPYDFLNVDAQNYNKFRTIQSVNW